jgi:hypothetical protein
MTERGDEGEGDVSGDSEREVMNECDNNPRSNFKDESETTE